jgi:hypothetical protein
MEALMNTSIMSSARAALAGAQGVVKMARQVRARAPSVRSRLRGPFPYLTHAPTPSQAVKGMGQDGKFFRDSKRGEASELRQELASPDLDVMKDAVKKVIAAITVGKGAFACPECA